MDEVTGATVESPSTSETGTDTSAGTVNTGSQVQNGQQNGAPPPAVEKPAPFHTHPRWQEMQRNNRAMQTELAQLRQWRQQQQAAQQPGQQIDPEMAQAHQALEQLISTHPKLKNLLGLIDQMPQLQQGVQQLTQAQSRSLVHTGRTEIASLAKSANLPTSDKALSAYEEIIASRIRQDPDLQARFAQGDLASLREAFDDVKAVVGEFRRGDLASTAQTKANTLKLPPRPSGGVPGAPSPPPLTMKAGEDPRGFTSRMHKAARDLRAQLEG